MHAGALRALEFDRIVEAVRSFALTPLGRRVWRSSSRSSDRARGRERARRRRPKAVRFLARRPDFPLRAPADLDARPARRSPSRAARSSRSGCSAWPSSSTRSSHVRRDPDGAQRLFPLLAGHRRDRGLVPARDRRRPAQDRPVRRGRRPRQPGARGPPRPPAQAAGATARHARVVPARPGHGEVPAGPGRHRPQRPLRPRRPQPSTATAIPGIVHGSSAQRRQPLPRAAQHGRDQQRHRRARGAGARGSPPHPARAHRRLPAARRRSLHRHDRRGHRARRDPGARRASRAWSTAIAPALCDRRPARAARRAASAADSGRRRAASGTRARRAATTASDARARCRSTSLRHPADDACCVITGPEHRRQDGGAQDGRAAAR